MSGLLCAAAFGSGSTVRKRSQEGVQNRIKALANIFGKEPQHEISMPLKQRVLAPVAPIRFGVREMLSAVQLDDQGCACA